MLTSLVHVLYFDIAILGSSERASIYWGIYQMPKLEATEITVPHTMKCNTPFLLMQLLADGEAVQRPKWQQNLLQLNVRRHGDRAGALCRGEEWQSPGAIGEGEGSGEEGIGAGFAGEENSLFRNQLLWVSDSQISQQAWTGEHLRIWLYVILNSKDL